MNNQKFNAKPQEFEGVRFDSKWELSVYLFLRGYIPKLNIKIHEKILIKPQTCNYPAKYWKCDFVIRWANKQLLIEAKGIPTPDFKRQLQLIDSNYPDLIPLIRIVTTDSIRIDERFQSFTPKTLTPELKQIRKEILSQ